MAFGADRGHVAAVEHLMMREADVHAKDRVHAQQRHALARPVSPPAQSPCSPRLSHSTPSPRSRRTVFTLRPYIRLDSFHSIHSPPLRPARRRALGAFSIPFRRPHMHLVRAILVTPRHARAAHIPLDSMQFIHPLLPSLPQARSPHFPLGLLLFFTPRPSGQLTPEPPRPLYTTEQAVPPPATLTFRRSRPIADAHPRIQTPVVCHSFKPHTHPHFPAYFNPHAPL
jgi:hypothetical protein